MRGLTVDGASDGEARAEDFLDGSDKLLGHGLVSHSSGDVDDGIKGDVSTVLDVLDLLSVSWGFLELLQDQGRGSWNDSWGGHTIDDTQSNSDLDTLPVHGGLLDIFTDLLWGL